MKLFRVNPQPFDHILSLLLVRMSKDCEGRQPMSAAVRLIANRHVLSSHAMTNFISSYLSANPIGCRGGERKNRTRFYLLADACIALHCQVLLMVGLKENVCVALRYGLLHHVANFFLASVSGFLLVLIGALQIDFVFVFVYRQRKLECGPMPNLMVALPNIGGALCSTPQSLADAHY